MVLVLNAIEPYMVTSPKAVVDVLSRALNRVAKVEILSKQSLQHSPRNVISQK